MKDITMNDIEKLIAEKLTDQATKHADSGWITPTFGTNIVVIGSSQICRLIGNILHISTTLTINEAVSNNKTLVTLPVGYRPARIHSFPCSIAASTTTRTVQFQSDGAVKLYANGATIGSGTSVYLDFCFPID